MLLYGCPLFVAITDHKPMVSVFSDKSLSSIDNPRLFKMKEKTLHFSFEIKHIPGAKMIVADALSRYPVCDPNIEDEISSSGINTIAVSSKK